MRVQLLLAVSSVRSWRIRRPRVSREGRHNPTLPMLGAAVAVGSGAERVKWRLLPERPRRGRRLPIYQRGSPSSSPLKPPTVLGEDDAPPLPFIGRLEAVKSGANPSD